MSDDEDQEYLFPSDEQPGSDDAANAKAIAKKKRRNARKQKEHDHFWQSCLATEVGRRSIWELLNDCGVFRPTFACGPNGFPQPEATWFKAGQQDFAQRWFFTLQRIDPAAVWQMQLENDPRFAKRAPVKAESDDNG